MNIERLRKIIVYSEKNHEEINYKVKRFCSFAGIEYDSNPLNILQIIRSSFQKKGFLVLEMLFADDEIYHVFWDEQRIANYYCSIAREQDEHSPHCYAGTAICAYHCREDEE